MLGLRGFTLDRRIVADGPVHVYAGTRDEDGVPVLARLIPAGGDLATIKRLQREFKVLSRVHSDGVLKPLALEQVTAGWVMVTQAAEGSVGIDQYAEEQDFGLSLFLSVAISVADTLAEVHDAGVVHRDIRPGNVLIDPYLLRVRLTGFVFSGESSADLTDSGTGLLRAMLPYIAPERTGRMDRSPDYRADLYSLGATLYRLAVGRPPFEDSAPLEIVHAHLAKEPTPPHVVDPNFPEMPSRIILKLLEKEPGDRYQSASALRADLKRCQDMLDERGRIDAFVIDASEVATHLRPSDQLYGRAFELGILRQALHDVQRQKEGRLVMLSGQPGVGKTALVSVFQAEVVKDGIRFIQGRFDPYSGAAPYAVFRRLFARFVDEVLAGSDTELDTWRKRLTEGLDPIAQAAVELVPKLGWLLGPQHPLPEVSAEQANRRLVSAVVKLLGVMSSHGDPVVLFLDDLQWADAGSLRLLEGLASQGSAYPMLILGAYQHREVVADHPLSACLDRLWESDLTARAMRLQPLRASDVNRLVADTLGHAPADTEALTDLIARKTDNNPLFVKQFLVYACERGLFRLALDGSWSWNLAEIDGAGIPDDVAGMMTDKVARLPLRVQRVLKHAGIIGMAFDLDTLMALDPSRGQLQKHLERLLEEGLIADAGEGFRFTHERIRDAVHAMVPPIEAARLYRLVGRHRLLSLGADGLEDHVFEVVDPLNRALALLGDADERLQLAALNLVAGRKAQDTSAPDAALRYLRTGIGLLQRGDWDESFDLCFDLHVRGAQVARMVGDLDLSEELYRSVLTHPLPSLRAAEVCGEMVALYAAMGQPGRAVRVGMMGLRRLGVRPRRRGGLLVFWDILQAQYTLWRTPESRWMALQPATDPAWIAKRRISHELLVASFFVDGQLMAGIAARAGRSMLKRGYYMSPALHVAVLSLLWTHLFDRPRRGYQIGQLALRLVERYPDAPGNLRARHIVHGLVVPWARRWRDGIDPLERIHHEAMASGESATAVFAVLQRLVQCLLTGDPLQEVEEQAQQAAGYARTVGQKDSAMMLEAIADGAYCLRGMRHDIDVATAVGLPDLLAQRSPPVGTFGLAIVVLVLATFGRYAEARDFGERFAEHSAGSMRTLLRLHIDLLHGVSAAATAKTWSERRRARKLLKRSLNVHRRLARTGGAGFAAHEAFARAELARLAGKGPNAQAHYSRARTSASNGGLMHLAGMALERQHSLAQQHGWSIEARAYLEHARRTYKAWGADSKVQALVDRFGAASKPRSSTQVTPAVGERSMPPTWTGGREVATHSLDLATVMATARALSEQVTLDEVVERVLSSAIENAGANRSLLILNDEDVLRVEAEYSADGQYRRYSGGVPLDDAASRLPISVVRFVARTAEAVVLDAASEHGSFTTDPYIEANTSRSVLCVPILKRTKLVGVLYLENTLVARAFTDERQSVLRLVAGQAAISLENARLVEALTTARDDLERRVEERTRELVSLQDDLVGAARRAGMAEVATGVLHNVGNILNSVNTSTTELDETLRRSRLPSLERTVQLLNDRRDDLVAFLVEDERGRLVPEFLRLVAQQLTHEQARMRRAVELLTTNVEHVRQVISAQQAFAGVGGVMEEADVEELVEESIRISGATRPWRDQHIVRNFDFVPPVPVERHKVLQILVNVLGNARDALDHLEGNSPHSDLRIVISVRQDANRVLISVRDFGVGIEKHDLQRVFSHGFTTKKNGHGFGLHSSAIAARQLGGMLRAESDGPGRGATFTLDLPLVREASRSETG